MSRSAGALSAGVLLALLLVVQLSAPVAAFYLPGVAPRDYITDEPVYMKVNSLTSAETQLPYKYYDLPFCRPPTIVDMVENLGEILSGDRIENSPYVLHAGRNVECKVLCETTLDKEQLALLAERIDEEYRVNWFVSPCVKLSCVREGGRE
jgi:transmembrane 9 superfamily member 2/4